MLLVCFCCHVDLLGGPLLQLTPSAFLSQQFKCAYIVLAKAPLPEEAIFNQNKAAERRCVARKAQHKERQITKRD
jgi:hypothetical protein